MIQTPAIVTFANQKGGVGKTTLCVTFANYLLAKGVRVVIIDCDFQHSILKCRKADLKKYGEELVPYEIWAYEPDNKEAMTSLIEKLHNDPELDVVLMDSPGSLHAEGLVPMFVNSDIIVVPFHYDLVTIPSTASFLLFLDRLRQAVGEGMNAQLFIIPNLNDNLSYANGISSSVTAHFKVEQLSGQFISFGYGSLRYGLFLQLLDVVGECFCIFARDAAFLVDFGLILRRNLLQRVNGFLRSARLRVLSCTMAVSSLILFCVLAVASAPCFSSSRLSACISFCNRCSRVSSLVREASRYTAPITATTAASTAA